MLKQLSRGLSDKAPQRSGQMRLIEYLRRPSISAYGEGISEVADYVAGVMRQMGLVVRVMPTSGQCHLNT